MASNEPTSGGDWGGFPLMGFPYETNKVEEDIIYQCFFPDARIALWKRLQGYAVNLYDRLKVDRTEAGNLTDLRHRYCKTQRPIDVEDAFEAQLAINYLIQTYLPTEVIDDVCNASKERCECSKRTHEAAGNGDAVATTG